MFELNLSFLPLKNINKKVERKGGLEIIIFLQLVLLNA